MLIAKVSTAISIIVGPILDSTGAEYASAVIGDLSLSKNGGTLTALAATATLTYIANGQYTLSLNTTNTNTLGMAQITCNKATYQMPTVELAIVPATVYNALMANEVNTAGGFASATGAITALAGAISTLTQTQVTGGAYALNSASFAFNAAMDFTTTQKAATLARVTLTDTVTTYTGNTPQTGDAFARIGVAGVGLTNLGDTRIANLDATVSSRSTLTQTQVTGGAYALNSALFAFNSALDFTTTQKAATLARVTLTDTVTTYTGNTPQTGDAFARIGLAGVGLTNLGDTRIANLDATVSSRSTLTQTQITGGAYALNSALFAFNSALDFTATQKAATLARVTLTDTVTTYTGNTPQTGDTFALIGLAGAGLTALAPAATALSTVTWTNTLATNLATTNTTVAANLDAAVSSRMATYTQPAGFLAATFPATVASPTNITAGTITTVTNLTNLPSIPLNWITAAGISAGALDGKGDWLLSSGYTAPPSAAAVASQVRTELSVELGRIDVATSTRLASTSYAAPLDAAGTRSALGLGVANMDTQFNAIYTVAGLVQAKTDNLPSTPASSADCITAAGVRTAIGMAVADLDTQLAAIYGAEQTSLANQIVMDTKLNNIKLDTAAILDDTGTTGVVISGGSGAAVASQVRTELSVELGRIDVATSTRLASTSYAAPLDAAGTRSAIGLGAANMDTQLNAIYTVAGLVQAKTDNLPATPASSADCITAAGVRTAIGMSEANLDTQLTAIYGSGQNVLANQIVMDTKLNNIKLDTAAILDDTGTTGVVISGGSGAALVASTAAQVTADHGSGSYVRNTEPSTAAQIWEYATRTLTSGSGGSGATAAEVWAYTDRTLTSGGGSGLTAAEVWAYAERTLTPLALDSIMAATGLEAGRYVDTDGNPVTQINLRQAIALLLAYSLGDRSGIGTRSIISKLAGETVQIEAERISQSVIEASGTVPV